MWTPWYTAAFVTGILSIIICIFSYIFPNRKITLILRMGFDAISIINGIFVYYATDVAAIWAVVAVDGIGIIRDIIYLARAKYKWADHWIWLIVFEVIFAASIFFTWAGPIALLPVIGSVISNTGLYIKDVKKTKIITIIGQVFFITYYAVKERKDVKSVIRKV